MSKLHAVKPDAPTLHDLALEAARAAPQDFCALDYQQWAWPWRFARRLRALPGVTDETDPLAFRPAFMEFCRVASIRELAREHLEAGEDTSGSPPSARHAQAPPRRMVPSVSPCHRMMLMTTSTSLPPLGDAHQ